MPDQPLLTLVELSSTLRCCALEQMRIAIISDTHGLLRPEVEAFVQTTDLVFHAGDVGKADVLDKLRATAPLKVVRGNVDSGPWAQQLPSEIFHLFPEQNLQVIMAHKWQDISTASLHAPSLLIVGHSHKPELAMQTDGNIKLNPGSCGPRRFKLPVCAALMILDAEGIQIRVFDVLTQEHLFDWHSTSSKW